MTVVSMTCEIIVPKINDEDLRNRYLSIQLSKSINLIPGIDKCELL